MSSFCPLSSSGQEKGCFGVGLGVFGGILGKMRPIWAICMKSGQKCSRIGKTKFNHHLGQARWTVVRWPPKTRTRPSRHERPGNGARPFLRRFALPNGAIRSPGWRGLLSRMARFALQNGAVCSPEWRGPPGSLQKAAAMG